MQNAALISPGDTWTLWAFLITWSATSIFLEQRYKWGSSLSGPVIALIGGLIASNTGIIPTKSPVYDTVWNFIVPMCIPLLLLKCDLRKIWRETGRMFGAFHVSSLGTILGAFAAAFLLGSSIKYVAEVAGIMTASYIGGSINFVATVSVFKPPESEVNALIVADNLVMALHIMAMIALPGVALAVRWFGTLPDKELYGPEDGTTEKAEHYWSPHPISLLDIGKNLSLAFIIVTLSGRIHLLVEASGIGEPFLTLLGNEFLLYTTLTVVFVLLFPNFSNRLRGTQEMGTFAIYIFFVLIGVPASLRAILLEAPLLLVLCAVMILVNVLITFGVGRLFGYRIQEMALVSVANIAGPMNCVAIAISKKWNQLVLPSFLVGIWGYVIGTYCGVVVGKILQKLLY
jgi:uncharacterized membrane protein